MTKDKFIEVIKAIQSSSDFLDKLYTLGIDLYDAKQIKSFEILEDTILKISFTEEAIDVINWWLYEYDRVEPGMWDADKNVIPMETVEDLWNYVKDFLI